MAGLDGSKTEMVANMEETIFVIVEVGIVHFCKQIFLCDGHWNITVSLGCSSVMEVTHNCSSKFQPMFVDVKSQMRTLYFVELITI